MAIGLLAKRFAISPERAWRLAFDETVALLAQN
jgi:hypothetical protein